MKDIDIERYINLQIRVTCSDGEAIVGELYGYNYDYDDAGNEFIEIDIERYSDGVLVSVTDDEIVSIEVVN